MIKLIFLMNTQVANLRKAFAKHTSFDIKLSKTKLSKMIQSGGFRDRLLPSRQILVPRTSRGRPPPTSPRRPLKVLFYRPGDVPIQRPGDVLI